MLLLYTLLVGLRTPQAECRDVRKCGPAFWAYRRFKPANVPRKGTGGEIPRKPVSRWPQMGVLLGEDHLDGSAGLLIYGNH